MDQIQPVQQWLTAMVQAGAELAQATLGPGQYQVKSKATDWGTSDMNGVYLPIVSGEDAVLAGILSNSAGLKQLGAQILQHHSSGAGLSREETTDVLRALIDRIEPIMQREHVDFKPILKHGLPLFVEGYIQLAKEQKIGRATVEIGTALLDLVVIYTPVAKDQGKAIPFSEEKNERTDQHISIADWFLTAAAAMQDFCKITLNQECRIQKKQDSYPQGELKGAFITLIGKQGGAILGLTGTDPAIRELVRNFLVLEPGILLTHEDIADAIGEIVNILSGLMKRKLIDRQITLWNGLPIFINGQIGMSQKPSVASSVVEIGSSQVYLVIVQKEWSRVG